MQGGRIYKTKEGQSIGKKRTEEMNIQPIHQNVFLLHTYPTHMYFITKLTRRLVVYTHYVLKERLKPWPKIAKNALTWVRPKLKSSYFASDPKLKSRIIFVLKSTYVLKSAMAKIVWKYVVSKYKAVSIRKVHLSYFHGEKTNLKAKSWFNIRKFINFARKSS